MLRSSYWSNIFGGVGRPCLSRILPLSFSPVPLRPRLLLWPRCSSIARIRGYLAWMIIIHRRCLRLALHRFGRFVLFLLRWLYFCVGSTCFSKVKNQLNPEHALTVQLHGLPTLGGFCAKGTLGRLTASVYWCVPCNSPMSSVRSVAWLVRWLVFVTRWRLCLTSSLVLRGQIMPEDFVGFLTMLYPCRIG